MLVLLDLEVTQGGCIPELRLALLAIAVVIVVVVVVVVVVAVVLAVIGSHVDLQGTRRLVSTAVDALRAEREGVDRDVTGAHSRWVVITVTTQGSLVVQKDCLHYYMRRLTTPIAAQHPPCCSWTACCWTSFPDLQQEGNSMMARDGCLDYLGNHQNSPHALHALLRSLCDAGRFR